MKKNVLLLAGVIGLSACALAGDRGKTSAEPKPTDKQGETSITVLTKQAEAELGGKDLSFVVAVRRDGSIQLFKPELVKSEEFDFPIGKVKEISRIDPAALFLFQTNPHCNGWTSGGSGYRFCPPH